MTTFMKELDRIQMPRINGDIMMDKNIIFIIQTFNNKLNGQKMKSVAQSRNPQLFTLEGLSKLVVLSLALLED